MKYKCLSSNKIDGDVKYHTPILCEGEGKIIVGKNVHVGYSKSPFYFSSYVYFEARKTEAKILIGSNVWFNNSCTLISDGSLIEIGSDCLFGSGLNVFDSDFHSLEINERNSGNHLSKPVKIGKNVFTGVNVTILKGVEIGDNSVIAAGSLVVNDIPPNVVAGGSPAVILKYLDK